MVNLHHAVIIADAPGMQKTVLLPYDITGRERIVFRARTDLLYNTYLIAEE